MSKKLALLVLPLAFLAALPSAAVNAQTVVAAEDFDGGDINLITPFDTNLNFESVIELFRRFGVFNINDFQTGLPAPFALIDDSMFDVSGNGQFTNDFEGVFGIAKDPMDSFFCACSYSEFNEPDASLRTGTWVFDVSSTSDDLTLSIDWGQISDDRFDGVPAGNTVMVEYRFDNQPFAEAMSLGAFELVETGFMYRDMDAGNNATIDFFGDSPNDDFPDGPPATAGTHLGLAVLTPGVTKTLADTGAVAGDTIVNKSEPATGSLDTFSVPLVGNGSTLELRIEFEFSFEAVALDNIVITTAGGKKELIGDVNCDGEINLLDVSPFVDLLLTGGFSTKADITGDGNVDLLDVAPFVDLLTGG